MGWLEFILALIVFMASHRIPASPRVRGFAVGLLGRRGYAIVFSLLSTALLFWVIFAAGRAPFVLLWDQELWQRWAANVVMPLALLLGTYGVLAPNPFAFEGVETGFDPRHPGIAGVTRQPLLWAMVLWATVHLLANGDLAHVILFGLFLLFGLVGMRILERRKRRIMGEARWNELTARTGLVPFAALLLGRWRPAHWPSLWRLLIWAIIWVGLWHLHLPVIGVSPAP